MLLKRRRDVLKVDSAILAVIVMLRCSSCNLVGLIIVEVVIKHETQSTPSDGRIWACYRAAERGSWPTLRELLGLFFSSKRIWVTSAASLFL